MYFISHFPFTLLFALTSLSNYKTRTDACSLLLPIAGYKGLFWRLFLPGMCQLSWLIGSLILLF